MNQREIKFRAWDRVNKRMGQFDSGFGWDDEYFLWYLQGSDISDVPCGDNIELMQYTGLLDKNGKEIYEGDIMTSEDKKEKLRVWVVWNNSRGCWELDDNRNNGEYSLTYKNWYVIGNLYENPELLKLK